MDFYYGHQVVTKREGPTYGPEFLNAVTVGELTKWIESKGPRRFSSIEDWHKGKLRDENMLLTFDDGYADNMTNLIPICESYDIPVTIFVNVGLVIGDEGPFEYALAHSLENHLLTPDENRASETRGLTDTFHRMKTKIRNQPGSAWNRWCELAGEKGIDYFSGCPDFLDVQQLIELSEHPLVTIGAHGISHSNLNYQTPRQQLHSINASKKWIEDTISKEVRWFAYPSGRNNLFSRMIVRICGFSGAFATENGQSTPHLFRNGTKWRRQNIRNCVQK